MRRLDGFGETPEAAIDRACGGRTVISWTQTGVGREASATPPDVDILRVLADTPAVVYGPDLGSSGGLRLAGRRVGPWRV
ncbi:MAG: hypothetical protein ACE5GB_10350 [Acidimicrobiales bacterium]